MEETKYAVYLVIIEDTNEAYSHLTVNVDTIETVKLELSYDEALDLIQEKAWG